MGLETDLILYDLTLQDGQNYFFSIQATNAVGLKDIAYGNITVSQALTNCHRSVGVTFPFGITSLTNLEDSCFSFTIYILNCISYLLRR